MKIKFKLSIVVITIMAVVITGIFTTLLQKASRLSMDLSTQSLEHLADYQAAFWKGREDGYIRALSTLANVLSDYESIQVEKRRDWCDDLMRSALEAESQMILVKTVWKPNALDGMDEYYRGRPGSSPSGQYAVTYSKETGVAIKRASNDIENEMMHITGPDARKDRVEDPVPWKINGNDKYAFRMSVPIINKNTGEVLGSFGCMLVIDAIQSSLEDTLKANSNICLMVMYSGDGTILGHFIPDRVGKQMLDVEVELGSGRKEILTAAKNGSSYKSKIYDPLFNDYVIIIAKPIKIGNSDHNWSMSMGVRESQVYGENKAMRRFAILLSTISIILTAVIIFVVLGHVTKPIVTVTNTLKDISEGEGDLTRIIPEKGNDEIAAMSRYFNLTLAKIKNLVVSIKDHAGTLSDTGNELASNMTETAAAMNEITANIQNIKGQVINQSASVSQTGTTMQQITNSIDRLNVCAQRQVANISQSSSSIEEMIANIQSVTQTLVKNGESVNELNSSSELGRTSLQDAFAIIQEIERNSEGLLEINKVINDIASQTNLLSMNAAIEAAHAGEAGRGFSVVADEIRSLAESSSEQSKIIRNVLCKMKELIDSLISSTGDTLIRFEVINSDIKTVSEQVAAIRDAMNEQNEGSNNILEAVGELNEITSQVKNEFMQMNEGSREVIQESKNLDQVTQEITGGINEMASGAQQINQAVCKVNEISVRNRDNIDILVREVSLFKVA